jgi:glycosyltransferase involved in cell wall biosynthesis
MAGGLERMIVAIMNALADRGHVVSLFSWDGEGAEAFYPLDPAVTWYRLGIGDPKRKAGFGDRLARVRAIRGIVKQAAPDVVVCFQGGPFKAMLCYLAGMGLPIIAAERTSPSLFEHANSGWARTVEHQAFRFASRITVQFERYRQLYPPFLRGKITVISNAVPPAPCHADPSTPDSSGRFRLLSVGRLAYQKNYPVLINAFAAIARKFPDWDLWIAGEGDDRQQLERQIADIPALAGRAHMPGALKDISSADCAANLFCLPALWEGFPNALAEALAHGLPSVGFAGCDGVPDLIEHGVTGFLAGGNDDATTLS